jgi:hypothetical protein
VKVSGDGSDNLLQLVSWFPKTVLGGGAWKILKAKRGLNQKKMGTPALDYVTIMFKNQYFLCFVLAR